MSDNANDRNKPSGRSSESPEASGKLGAEPLPKNLRGLWHRTDHTLEKTVRDREQLILFDGPPGCGKTTSIFDVARRRGKPLTYLAARHDLYDQAIENAIDAGFSRDEISTQPSPHEHCPTFKGVHGSDICDDWIGLYRLGIPAWAIHDRKSAPCQPGCPYMEKRGDNPDEYEVVIGHYVHAHDSKKLDGRLTVNEFPSSSFVDEFGTADGLAIADAVDPLLRALDQLPYGNYGDLLEHRDQLADAVDAGATLCNLGLVQAPTDLLDLPEEYRHHKLAPFIVFGLLEAKDLGNGWEAFDTRWYGSCDPTDEPFWTRTGLDTHRVLARKKGDSTAKDEIYVLTPPNLDSAEQVIGLDGTPRKVMWDAVFGVDFTLTKLIPDDQMQEYVEEMQDITVERTGNGTKPYGSGNHVAVGFDTAMTMWMDIEKDAPVFITLKKAGETFQQEEPELFQNHITPVESGNEPYMTYGMVESNNDATGTGALHVCGSPHVGDEEIEKWGALMGVGVHRRPGTRGEGLTYDPQPLGDEIYHHYVHDRVGQAIMRARKGSPDDGGGYVLVNTKAHPDWISPEWHRTVPEDYPLRFGKKRAVARYLMENGSKAVTQDELDDALNYHRKRIGQTLKDFENRGWVDVTWNSDGAKVYRWAP